MTMVFYSVYHNRRYNGTLSPSLGKALYISLKKVEPMNTAMFYYVQFYISGL